MATKATIKAEIQSKIGANYAAWRIGLTHDLAGRKTYWKDTMGKDVSHWANWTADSLSDAQDIESHFINKGTVGGTGGDLSANKTVYVYIF
jgi:hypothetical protein